MLQRSPDLAVGDRSAPGRREDLLPGFNGAPTSRSGIDRHSRCGSPTTCRFNGAPTSRSGIDHRPRPPLHRNPASTEPRPRGRGSPGSRARTAGSSTGFNGAPTSRSGIALGVPRVAGERIRFNGAPTSRSGIEQRPRAPRGRTNMLQRSPDLAVGDRPSFARPSPARSCFNGAPTSRSGIAGSSGAPLPVDIVLQRSPDLAVGDRCTGSACSSTSTGFNGAPTSRSGIAGARERAPPGERASTEPRPRGRGSLEALEIQIVENLLQRSPDLAVGDRQRRARLRPRRARFNGAPTSRSGIAGGTRSRSTSSPGFNGAPTSRSGIEAALRGTGLRRWRFNGAPTSRSGIGLDLSRRETRERASTEPRPRGRGSTAAGPAAMRDLRLQRSPDLAVGDRRRTAAQSGGSSGFNGAPTSRSGIGPVLRRHGVGRSASTEPRPRGRGSGAGARATRPANACFNGAPTSRSGIAWSVTALSHGSRSFNGAPTSRSGIVLLAGCGHAQMVASTEPRPRGRGSIVTRSRSETRNRLQRSPDLAVGDRGRCSTARPSPGCFNGAPTSRSGIAARRKRCPGASTCFNGAPTSRSGIVARSRRRRARSPSFNGAPTSRSGIGPARSRGASAQSSFNGAPTSRSGIERGRTRLRALRRASTEPRPRGRGSVHGGRGREDRRPASTEPRPRGRGSTEPVWSGVTIYKLQRSPDLAVGDRTRSSNGLPSLPVLQRSPDLAVGDRRPRRRAARGRPCFNGAPTSRSGIVTQLLHFTAGNMPLQRSPDLAVGDRRRHGMDDESTTSFNGAPTSRSGIDRREGRLAPRGHASTEPRPRGRGS